MKLFQYWLDCYYLVSTDLRDNIMPDYHVPQNFLFRIINSENDPYFDSLCSLWGQAYHCNFKDIEKAKYEVLCLFKRGDVCFCAIKGNKAVGMGWAGGEGAINEIDFAHVLKRYKKVALAHHDFVSEDYRGYGLQKALSYMRIEYAIKNEFGEMYGFIGIKNSASLKNLMTIFKKYRIIYHLKIDIPLKTFNLFPCYAKESWTSCKPIKASVTRIIG